MNRYSTYMNLYLCHVLLQSHALHMYHHLGAGISSL